MEPFAAKQKFALTLGAVLFLMGFALGFFLNARAVWSHVASMSFWGYPEEVYVDLSLVNEVESKVTQFRCPLVVSRDEAAEVRIRLKNPQAYEVTPFLDILSNDLDASGGVRRVSQDLALEAGQTKDITYELQPAHFSSGGVILIRALLTPSKMQLASFTRQCGVIVFQLGRLRGADLIRLGVGVSGILILSGMGIWRKNSNKSMRNSSRMMKGMTVLALFLLANTFASLLAWNLAAIALLILTILGFFAILQYVVN
jgi:hypothetical protein